MYELLSKLLDFFSPDTTDSLESKLKRFNKKNEPADPSSKPKQRYEELKEIFLENADASFQKRRDLGIPSIRILFTNIVRFISWIVNLTIFQKIAFSMVVIFGFAVFYTYGTQNPSSASILFPLLIIAFLFLVSGGDIHLYNHSVRKIPDSVQTFKKDQRPYGDIVKELKQNGFYHVTLKPMNDLPPNDTIDDIIIDGVSMKNVKEPHTMIKRQDASIEIRYHSPQKEKHEST